MKQVFQNLRSGIIEMMDLPHPAVLPGHLLIQTRASLISAGTERMLVEFGQASLLAKARSQPEKVRRVLEKISTDGLLPTLETVFARLEEPLPLGYCNAGVVLEAGAAVEGFRTGDRVASNGPHAEIVSVPRNLCARIPDSVTDEEAAFTVLGAVALHGARLLNPTLGESVAVIGLGLVGLLAAQCLRAHGCRVIGIDPNAERQAIARTLGLEDVPDVSVTDPVRRALAFSRDRGVDAVLITASSSGPEIIRQAARMARKRGRIVLVGVIGLELDRSEFYQKELTFQVSCSYGPGRYDSDYELRGHDYPLGYVRWTEQRNFEAVLDLLASRRLQAAPLISRRVPHAEAQEAYAALTSDPSALGLILQYPQTPAAARTPPRPALPAPSLTPRRLAGGARPRIGVIGAGAFARAVLLPALRRSGADVVAITSQGGASATTAARLFGIRSVAADARAILQDATIDTVFILTRHDSHARLAAEALHAGKHVFVEKPMVIASEELIAVGRAHRAAGRHMMVGYNRRFARHIKKMRELLRGRSGPASLVMTVNAGALPLEHWLHDPQEGGGRLLGEGVHWIDLFVSLVGRRVAQVVCTPAGGGGRGDTFTLTLAFEDGSIGTLHYFANGSRSFPKERLEAFFDGQVLRLDNFRVLRGYGTRGFRRLRTWRQDKGHDALVAAFLRAVEDGGRPVVPFEELEHVARVAFAAVTSARTGAPVALAPSSDAADRPDLRAAGKDGRREEGAP